jgi:hypothetical protein
MRERAASSAGCPAAAIRRFWLIVVDDLHVRFTDTGHLRDLLRTIAKELLVEGDLIAARSIVSAKFSIDATPDHELLPRWTRELSGNGLRLSDVLDGAGWADEVAYRSSLSLAAACEAISSITQVADRRKAVIYISNGYLRFNAGQGQHCDRPSGLTSLAKVAQVQIFPIDTRLLSGPPTPELGVDIDEWQNYWTRTQDSLRGLAQETHGAARLDTTDLTEWLRDVSRVVRQ